MSPRLRNLSQNFWSSGSSSTQGGHHVAQKWIRATFPVDLPRSTGLPSRVNTTSPDLFRSDESDGAEDRFKSVVKRKATAAAAAAPPARIARRELTRPAFVRLRPPSVGDLRRDFGATSARRRPAWPAGLQLCKRGAPRRWSTARGEAPCGRSRECRAGTARSHI